MEIEALDLLNRSVNDEEGRKLTAMIVARLDSLQESQKELSQEVKHMRRLMEKMIVLEERQNTQNNALTRFGDRLDKYEETLHGIEKCVDSRAFMYKWLERLIMLSSGAIIAYVMNQFILK